MSQTSVQAMRLSCEQLIRNAVANQRGVYLWTFTFADVIPPREAAARWNNFSRRIKRKYPAVGGVRVFEWHPGKICTAEGERHSHGVHVHLVSDAYLHLEKIRKMARGLFGRVHVKPAKDLSDIGRLSGYLSKYLRKGFYERPECLRGARLWANWGAWEGTRCKDVVAFSPYREWLRRIRVLAERGIDTWVRVLGFSSWLIPLYDMLLDYAKAKCSREKRRTLFLFLQAARGAYLVFGPELHERLQVYFGTDSGLTFFGEKSEVVPLALP